MSRLGVRVAWPGREQGVKVTLALRGKSLDFFPSEGRQRRIRPRKRTNP
jgi:hypothetical protein